MTNREYIINLQEMLSMDIATSMVLNMNMKKERMMINEWRTF